MWNLGPSTTPGGHGPSPRAWVLAPRSANDRLVMDGDGAGRIIRHSVVAAWLPSFGLIFSNVQVQAEQLPT